MAATITIIIGVFGVSVCLLLAMLEQERQVEMSKHPEWFFVVRYWKGEYTGEAIDAHYVQTGAEALARTSYVCAHGEGLRGYFARNMRERDDAIRLHDQRVLFDRQWTALTDVWEGEQV